MNKCPSCKSENVMFLDSSENLKYDPPEFKNECAQWEQYDCQDCGSLLEVENGYISVKQVVGLEYKTLMRYSVNWEKVLEEVFNDL